MNLNYRTKLLPIGPALGLTVGMIARSSEQSPPPDEERDIRFRCAGFFLHFWMFSVYILVFLMNLLFFLFKLFHLVAQKWTSMTIITLDRWQKGTRGRCVPFPVYCCFFMNSSTSRSIFPRSCSRSSKFSVWM